MKTKKIKLIFAVSISLLIIILGVTIFILLFVGNSCIKVDGNSVNAQFNYLSDFVRNENKLYYNYYGNIFNSGLYEISENGTKKLNSAEIALLPEYSEFLPSLLLCDNQVMKAFDNGLCSVESNEIKPFSSDVNFEWDEITTFNEKVYILCSDEINSYIYCYKNDGLNYMCKLDKVVSAYCIDDEYLYYIETFDEKISIYRQSLSTKDDCKQICEISTDVFNIKYFFMNKNNTFIVSSNASDQAIQSVNNHNKESLFSVSNNGTVTLIYSGRSIYAKYINNQLLYSDNNEGLYMYDANKDLSEELTDKTVDDFWIVDDKYVYFSDESKKLYRLTIREKTLEKVFG